jgi:ATP-dependent DNA helicase RecG
VELFKVALNARPLFRENNTSMQIQTLEDKEAIEFCVREEGHFFDRKAVGIRPAKMQKIAVAFANADGGEFVVGIADSGDDAEPAKRWQGLATQEDFNQHIQALTEVTPTLPFRFQFLACPQRTGLALHVQVEKSGQVHSAADRTVYVRSGAQSLPLSSAEQITSLAFSKGAKSFEDYVVPSSRMEWLVDSKEIKNFLNDYSPKTDPVDFVVNQQLVDFKTWEPTVAGILLFSDQPSANMPRQCAVKIARYATREDEPEREHLKETYTVEGPLYPLLHNVVAQVKDIMATISVWTTNGLKPVEYPPETIWEILVNAVIHRDYSVSDNTQVLIYENRIEIISPGKFPAFITKENILEARFSRNPRIVRTLNRYKDAPNRDMGEGLNTAFQKMKDFKLQSPSITEVGNTVRVIIPHTPLASPEDAILEFLENNPTIKNGQARDLTGERSENAVKNIFYKLRDAGLIERVPGLEGSAAAWRLIK